MRFQQYLTEEHDIEQIGETLNKECSEYINILRKMRASHPMNLVKFMLHRGTTRNFTDITKITPRIKRKPRDTPKEIHYILDKLFKEKFGGSVRSQGVFAISSRDRAGLYGDVYPFFPIDGSKFVYSRNIDDILTELEEREIVMDTGTDDGEIRVPEDELEEEIKPIVNTYTDKNLGVALKEGSEVTFLCRYYYLIEPKHILSLAKKIIAEG